MLTPSHPSHDAAPALHIGEDGAGIHELIRQAPDAVIVISAQSVIQLWNPKAEIIFGWKADEVLGKPLAETIIPPTLRDAHHSGMARYLSTGEAHVLGKTVSLVALHRDGHQFPVSVTISPFDTAGERRFVAFLRDVSAEKETEAALEQNRKELESRAEELEQYAWMVSHDLKEPLRKITMFADIVQRRFGENIPAEAAPYLDKIVSATGRMNAVIDAVLAYANISRVVEEKRPVALSGVLAEAASNLELLIAEADARISVGVSLPPVLGIRVQLVQVFENLLANAIKYRSPDASPEISVEGELYNGRALIHVHDNGIGFGEEYAEKIFAPFQRLQTREVQVGTGIGLALCRKVVALHDGHISATSREGIGSTFTVELPVAP